MIKRLIFLLLFISTCLLTKAQLHDGLRAKYLSFSADSIQTDSTLLYAFKVRNAAIKESGKHSFNYYRSVNNIGYSYFLKENYALAKQYWLLGYKQIEKEPADSFTSTKSILYDNLLQRYLYDAENEDSAILFADKYLAIQSNIHKEYSYTFINILSELANSFEIDFGMSAAQKYFTRILNARAHLFGNVSREITAKVDSIVSLNAPVDMADIRLYLYSTTDSIIKYEELETIMDTIDEKDYMAALLYSNTMKDQALLTYSDTSHQFQKGLQQFAYVLQNVFDDTAAAYYCLRKGLKILDENKKEKTNLYSYSLLKLAEAYADGADYGNAINTSKQQLILSAELNGKDGPEYIEALTAIGRIYKNAKSDGISSYQNSVEYLTSALNKTEKYYGPNSNQYAYSLFVLGGTCITWGKLDSAASLYNAAYKIYNKNNYKDMYVVYRQLYMTYSYQGELAKSNAWLRKCLAIQRAEADTLEQDYLTDMHNLVLGYIRLKDWKEAGNFLSNYESIIVNNYKPHQYNYLTFLKLKVRYYLEIGKFNGLDSLVLFRLKTLTDSSLYFQNEENTKAEIINCYTQLADLYINQHKYEQAKLAAHQALQNIQQSNYDSLANLFQYYQLARIHKLENNNDSAVYYYSLGIAISKKNAGEPDTEAMMNLAAVYWMQNKTDTAERLMAAACELIKNSMIVKMAGFSEIEKQQYNLILQSHLYKYYSLQNEMHKTNVDANRTAYNFIIQLKGLLLNSNDYLKQSIKTSGNKAEKELYEDLVTSRKLLSAAWQQNSKERIKYKSYTDSLQNRSNNLEQQLSLNSDAYSLFQKQNNISIEDIQKKLKENEAALEFVSFPYFNKMEITDSIIYGAFIITAGNNKPVYTTLPYSATFNQLVSNQGINGRGNEKLGSKKIENAYKQLYKLIWKPILPYLQNKQIIYIAADGILNKVAFSCLQDSSRYLLDDYQLHFVSSTKDIVYQNPINFSTKPSIALFGGAYFNNTDTTSTSAKTTWKYLPASLTEVKNIAAVLQQKMTVQQFSGRAASEHNIKKLSGNASPNILHIATHGYYYPTAIDSVHKEDANPTTNIFSNNNNPMLRTGLLFANASHTWLGAPLASEKEDGVLTAFELSNLDLRNTQLAVLSACETGMGDVVNGEGVYGLQRAIKQAGVQKMIVSLWPVPDKETSEMMQLFYLKLSKGFTIAASFKFAQENMRKKYPANPALWGAFNLIQ